ncbi:MAG: DUF4258 domain-containing protein [Ktedonobacteraceae bacterium]|nr:DUF4258 domain-containing protein [Ktedonobacteraceae bacterium]MBA3944252.1 DUF4258 domain-containing protein [Herpetosiphonaceae bacterium]
MKPIRFSHHARQQMIERGAQEAEVIDTIRTGEKVPAKKGRQGFRKNFQYDQLWGGRTYSIKQVLAIVAEEPEAMIVVTVYTFYF